MESEPFVSIVIPTTGNVKFIRGLVDSVIKLDYPKDKFELIFIGDKPTKLIEKHSERVVKLSLIHISEPTRPY